MAALTRFVALLRGVNVGGHRIVKMERLRALFSDMGFTNVATYIQSGNVFFEAKGTASALAKKIARHLEEELGFDVVTFVRTVDELKALVASEPFAGVEADEHTRFLVMFHDGTLTPVTIPLASPKGDCEIVGVTHGATLLVLRQRPGRPVDPTSFLKSVGLTAPSTGRFFHTLGKMLAQR